MTTRRRVLVTGRVQGVFFRSTAREVAERLGLSGWARNRADGRFEACFQGEEQAVDEAVKFCHEGPPGARVAHVEVERADPVPGEHGFRVG